MSAPREILVTSALPYANAPLHLGHILEQVQADIFVRFHRLKGNRIHFVCADDAHGTAIMLAAKKEKISEVELIERCSQSHQNDSAAFLVQFDAYHSTHSSENETFLMSIFEKLKQDRALFTKQVFQLYDEEAKLFLPDRLIKGTCPRCNTPDQYGDNCEACGASYEATALKKPFSMVSKATPILKESEHWFLDLPKFANRLKAWIQATPLSLQVKNKLTEWFNEGLKSWDISRDAPYFGFTIPGTESKKYFYVWVDAPIGYLSATWVLCKKEKFAFENFWSPNASSEVYHFIGKDIAYFHTLFWPTLLMAGQYRLPTNVFVHGYLNINGAKMSKSRGTFILASSFLKHYPAEALRYYFASKLDASICDIDLDLDDFIQKVNADLVNKIVNLASRVQGFLHKYFEGWTSSELDPDAHFEKVLEKCETLDKAYESLNFKQITHTLMHIAIEANQYIDKKAPWKCDHSEAGRTELQKICSSALNIFRCIMMYLQPILPEMAQKTKAFLADDLNWKDRDKPLLAHRINVYQPLFERLQKTL